MLGLVGLVGSLGRVWGWLGLMLFFLNNFNTRCFFGFGGGDDFSQK